MKAAAHFRTFVLLFGAAVLAAIGDAPAEPAEIRGTIDHAGATAIPAGVLEIRIDDPSGRDGRQHRAAATRLDSDGGSRTMDFTLSSPLIVRAQPHARIIAELKRADGWLLSRGSVSLTGNAPLRITLYPAMY